MRFCDSHLLEPLGNYCLQCDNQYLALELSGEVVTSDDSLSNSVDLQKEDSHELETERS
jgi:hypothetical protein